MQNESEDDLFAKMMRDQGVTPLGEKQSSGKRRRVPIPPRVAVPVPPPPPAPTPTPMPAPAPKAPDPKIVALKEACAKLRGELAEAHELHLQKDTQLEKREARLVELQEQLKRAGAGRQRAEAQARASGEELAFAKKRLAENLSLREVLADRGLADERECIAAIAGLLLAHGAELLRALELSNPRAMTELLAQRVALVEERFADKLTDGCVVIPVDAPRCEIAGGSDIRARYHDLITACQAKAVKVITIVGGSPAYRDQLSKLAESKTDHLRLNLVSGTQRRTKHRTEADLRTSDLVVIWGGTELDHSLTAVYAKGGVRHVVIAHRGMCGMLARLLEVVEA